MNKTKKEKPKFKKPTKKEQDQITKDELLILAKCHWPD